MDNGETKVRVSFDNDVSNIKDLDKYVEKLREIYGMLSAIDKGKLAQLGEFNYNVNKTKDNVKEINKNTNKFKKNLSDAFQVGKIIFFTKQTTKLVKSIANLVKVSSDYVENINLLEVAYSNINKETGQFNEDIETTSQRIETLVNKMSDIYGLDESRLAKSFGIFKQLANAMELPTKTGENLSELMVKMSNDIASLYNLDIDRASNALQSALAGQVRPIRTATGADITEKTLQKTVDNLGLNTSISQLSFVEKRLIMIISLTDQLRNAQGDYGRTIESVANQTKIMHEQWNRLTRALGNVFYPILERILPYLNAVLMVLTEIFNIVAALLGFKMPKFDYSGLAGVSDSANDIIEGMNGASDSVDKLSKKLTGLRNFDKLNVISTPKSSSSGVGNGKINDKILDAFQNAFEGYNDMLEKVNMKAREIRDNIMHWLGFEEKFNENGEKSWIFKKVTAGTVIGALAVGGTIYKGVSFIFNILKKVGLLKFPIISKLTSLITGKGTEATDTLNVASGVADSANNNSSKLKVPSVKSILTGLADIALIIGGCTAILVAMGGIASIPGIADITTKGIDLTAQVFKGLGSIVIPLGAMSGLIGVMGQFSVSDFAKGLADLAIIIGGCEAVILIVGAIASIPYFKDFIATGIEQTKKVIEGIADIIVPLGTLGVVLGVAGLAGGAGVTSILVGLGELALVVGGLEIVLVAIGALNEIPGFQWLVDKGMEVMLKIAEFIGKFVGSIVGGIVEGASSMLPQLGTDLSNFMVNGETFFENASKIDEKATQGISNLASALLKLTGVNVIEGLTSWFAGKVSLEKFGEDLVKFGPNFANYADAVKDIDNDVVVASSSAAKSLTEFASLVPYSGGLVEVLAGSNSISKFGKNLASFGKDFADYADEVKNVNNDVVEKSASASKSLAEFAGLVPYYGGLKDVFVGSNSISTFGDDLWWFGVKFADYYDEIKNVDSSIVQKSADAVSSIVEFARLIPNQGGFVSLFTGDNKLSDFGTSLSKFGVSFAAYYFDIHNIDTEKVKKVNSTISDIILFAKSIKSDSLNTVIKDFGTALKDSASNINNFYKNALTENKGSEIGSSFGKGISNGIKTAIKTAKYPTIKISTSVGNLSLAELKISAYGNGGLPPVGQLMLVNEKGPELVGQIGGQSFVANQDQVVDFLDRKTKQMSNQTPQIMNFYLDAEHKIGSYTLDQLQNMAKTDGKPIMIGG